jgi:pSer/pThr/pTyr-binding forkhead associated (FHA) protein
MAKLYLKFEQAVLKEFALSQGVVTIGRLPDNLIQIDNLAVSGHHAKIYWETDHYVLEDNNSLNGTFVNGRRVSKVALKDADEVTIGKHVLALKDEWHEDAGGKTQPIPTDVPKAMVPTLESTVVLDTKKAREMLARSASEAAAASSKIPAPAAPPPPMGGAPAAAPAMAAAPPPPAPTRERTGSLMITKGSTDQSQYTLSGKLSVIGKSEMASIKLKGWFKPKVAAVINRREGKYFIAASEKDQKVKVNGALIAGQHELAEGDMIEVAGISATFNYAD